MTRTPTRMNAFLAAYARIGVVERAAKAVNISKVTHYNWLEKYPEYRQQFERAHKRAGYVKQDVLDSIVCEGEPVLHEGQPVFAWVNEAGEIVPERWVNEAGEVVPYKADDPTLKRDPTLKQKLLRKTSIPALLFALRAAFPKKYRERQQVDVTSGGDKIRVADPVQQLMAVVAKDPQAFAALGVLSDRISGNGNGYHKN